MPPLDRNLWWSGLPEERYWLEVTARDDIGTNLKAPQGNERGAPAFSYSLVTQVKPGDIVFHYDKNRSAITGRSVAVGSHWEDSIVWAARGTSARSAGTQPHIRPGYYLGLERFERLSAPLSLEQVRAREAILRSQVKSLQGQHEPRLHFPFGFSNTRPIRPMQGYLFKLPKFFVEQFGLDTGLIPEGNVQPPIVQGAGYRRADEQNSVGARDPFEVDPAIVERGLHGHAVTQNRLADHLRTLGLEPQSPSVGQPNFDIAWKQRDTVFVAEVKSITDANEEKQLRLALGQVLRYSQRLGGYPTIRPVIVMERAPTDTSWARLCESLNVVLTWPEDFTRSITLVE